MSLAARLTATMGFGGAATFADPIKNLLKCDCVAYHAKNITKIVPLEGSQVPQV